MANLKFNEKQLFEKLFDRGGYVLNFTNRTFEEFFKDFKISIYSNKYNANGDSKMKRLRAFWELEPDTKVAEVLSSLLQYADTLDEISKKDNDLAIKYINKLKGVNTTSTISQEITEDIFLKQEFEKIELDSLGLESGLVNVLDQRIKEIQKGLKNKSSLSVLFLCGSSLEGVLLGIATRNPKEFNKASSSPKNKETGSVKAFHQWTLNDLINVSHQTGFIGLHVKKFSHALRDFRNYIHPYEQWNSGFNPNSHTAEISWQVFKAAVHDINQKLKQ